MTNHTSPPPRVTELSAALSQPRPMRRGSVNERRMKCGQADQRPAIQQCYSSWCSSRLGSNGLISFRPAAYAERRSKQRSIGEKRSNEGCKTKPDSPTLAESRRIPHRLASVCRVAARIGSRRLEKFVGTAAKCRKLRHWFRQFRHFSAFISNALALRRPPQCCSLCAAYDTLTDSASEIRSIRPDPTRAGLVTAADDLVERWLPIRRGFLINWGNC
jgi:hypothetical protein